MNTSVRRQRMEDSIEILENRIAPSSITFVDVDGDAVTIKSSKGDLTGKATFDNLGAGKQLVQLDLADSAFQGADIRITAAKSAHGDGLVNVGYINATGRDLKSVTVDGDLGRIDAGDAISATVGLLKLNVHSLGRLGSATQPMGVSNLASNVIGKLGAVNITTDLAGAMISVSGVNGTDAHGQPVNFGQIALLKIGGSFIGGAQTASGGVSASGDITKISIGDDLLGGSATGSGVISSGGKISAVSIGGSLDGGGGDSSGSITSTGSMGVVTIGGNLAGGTGSDSGALISHGKLTSVTIGKSLLGGSGPASGKISADLQIGTVQIRNNVQGGDGTNSARVFAGGTLGSLKILGSFAGGLGNNSADVNAQGIGTIQIGHDIVGGKGNNSAYLNGGHQRIEKLAVGGSWIGGSGGNSAFIYTSGGLGPTTIGGDLRGGAGSGSGQIDVEGLDKILIRGSMVGGAGNYSGQIYSDGNIGPVTILGDIQGGAGSNSGQIQGAQQYITSVKIGGSIIGGTGSGSGGIDARGHKVGPITIGGSIIGGSVSGTASLINTGFIHIGHADTLTVGGSIITGMDTSTGTLFNSGSLSFDDDVGTILIKGNLIGNSTTPLVILATGTGIIGGTDNAIGKLTVMGRVEHTLILGGYAFSYSGIGTASDGNAQIGKVTAGQWIASTIVAGVTAGMDDLFGTPDDSVINGLVGSIAHIASITIAGKITGTAALGDHFGFIAPKISAMKFAGTNFTLNASADVIEFSPATGDITFREI